MIKTEEIPRLENGDRLSRPEFERRYHAMPNHQKAELIERVVYLVASPLRFERHAEPHASILTWLTTYRIFTPRTRVGDTPTVRLDLDNEPQPDAVLFLDRSVGGQVQISEDDYLEGAPELIVEVAASSVAIDLFDKKRAYQRNGVKEYLVWQIYEHVLDWFCLEQGEYRSLQPNEQGIIQSPTFPGLWLAVPELLAGNMAQVLATLQTGLQSEEHEKFVQKLTN
ncbi:Uma2 family endonuclease [Pleurocapsales cyanobacterium LEGE 06147]|nr:Uma2 family endonuclease [Pleurocapsales cyanobacterium LEGE 06147]